MKRIAKFVAPTITTVLGLVLAMAFSQYVRAADAAATGTVSVTVTDKDGKPVDGATVRITAPRPPAAAKPAADAKLADPAAPAEGEKPAAGGGGGGNRAPAIAEGKTDKEGKAKLENVPAGEYNLSANLRGSGSARQKITVKAGDALAVELKLAPRATGGAGAAPAPAK